MQVNIYIVFGACGVYEGKKTWVVDAWPNQEAADKRVDELEDLKEELLGKVPATTTPYELFNLRRALEEKMRKAEKGDPGYINDVLTDTSYYTAECPLKGIKTLL